MKPIQIIALIPILIICSTCEPNPPQDDILARVGNGVVTRGDFESYLERLPVPMQAQARSPEKIREYLDMLIDREILNQKAVEAGLDRDPEIEHAVEMYRQKLMAQRLVKSEISTRPVNESLVREYYDKHPEEFGGGKMIRASQILVAKTRENARTTAEKIRADILAGQADFAAMARQHSNDAGTAPKGGDMGWVSPGIIKPELEQALFDLEKGRVSGVITTDLGFHILKANDIKSRPAKPFDVVAGEIRQKLAPLGAQDAFREYLASLRRECSIEVDENNLQKLIK